MRPLQFALHDSWDQPVDSLFQLVPKPLEVLPFLQWWSQRDNLIQGVPLCLPSLSYSFSLMPRQRGGMNTERHTLQTSGLWSTEQRRLHINILELLAVCVTLHYFQWQVANRMVVVMTNNMTVVGQIKSQSGTCSRALYRQMVLPFNWADCH